MTGDRIEVLVAAAPTTIREVQIALRDLVARAADLRRAAAAPDAADPDAADPDVADPGADAPSVRTWAVLGEFAVPDNVTGAPMTENQRVVEHDLIGRLAVRLAVDKTLCVGDSRAIRALHQGAVMEGSWGDEVRMVGSLDEARVVSESEDDWRPTPGDVVLIAGAPATLTRLAASWRDESGHDVVSGAAHQDSSTDSESDATGTGDTR